MKIITSKEQKHKAAAVTGKEPRAVQIISHCALWCNNNSTYRLDVCGIKSFCSESTHRCEDSKRILRCFVSYGGRKACSICNSATEDLAHAQLAYHVYLH
eukprot:3097664-Ditylum_brightwellii.AAC.1